MCAVLCCAVLLQSFIERVSAFVSAIINFYIWVFNTLLGTTQKAYGTVAGAAGRPSAV